MFDLSSQVWYPLQSFDLGMHFNPSAQANWSEGQERATPSWMLMMLVVRSNCKGAKCAIFYKALKQSYVPWRESLELREKKTGQCLLSELQAQKYKYNLNKTDFAGQYWMRWGRVCATVLLEGITDQVSCCT